MPRGIPKNKTAGSKAAGPEMTKMEAVRRALAALGSDAKPGQLQDFVKSNFGFDMPPNNISAYKTLLKKKAPQNGRRKPKAGTDKAVVANSADISKMEAVRRALTELGKDAMPVQLNDFVKLRFGIDMKPQHVSTYKSAIIRKGRRKRTATRKQPAPAAPATAAPASVRGGITLEDIKAVKALTDRIGADKVRELAAVLS